MYQLYYLCANLCNQHLIEKNTSFSSVAYQHTNLAKFLLPFLLPLSVDTHIFGLFWILSRVSIIVFTALCFTHLCVVLSDGWLFTTCSTLNCTLAFANIDPIENGSTAAILESPHWGTNEDAQLINKLITSVPLYVFPRSCFKRRSYFEALLTSELSLALWIVLIFAFLVAILGTSVTILFLTYLPHHYQY